MTKEEFQELTKKVVILDGATGTRMLAAGMPRGCCTEQWIMNHKSAITQLQKEYVDAGSQIVYAPTFGANGITLAKHGLRKQVARLNRRLVRYTREAVEGRAYVAGNITTTGRVLGYEDGYSYHHAYDNYCEQISAIAEEGVDLIVAETMIQFEETCAAINACKAVCDLPIVCTMTVRRDGGVYYGGNIFDYSPMFENMGVSAVGVNCSSGPSYLAEVIEKIKKRVNIPVVAKPNAGIPTIDSCGNAVYALQTEEFAGHMAELQVRGATLLGGCCGTTPEYIRAMKERLMKEGMIC